jgi:hypothetical protein
MLREIWTIARLGASYGQSSRTVAGWKSMGMREDSLEESDMFRDVGVLGLDCLASRTV